MYCKVESIERSDKAPFYSHPRSTVPASKSENTPLLTCPFCLYRACNFVLPVCSSFTLYSLAKRAPIIPFSTSHARQNPPAIHVACLLLKPSAEVALLASRSQQHFLKAALFSALAVAGSRLLEASRVIYRHTTRSSQKPGAYSSSTGTHASLSAL